MQEFSFRDWKSDNKLSNRTAADALGLSHRTVIRYVNGQMLVPRTVFLACLAIQEGLHMASNYTKTIPMQKRRAMGEPLTGMKKGGAVKKDKPSKGKPFNKGGKSC